MELTVPVLNQTLKKHGEKFPRYRVSALFFPGIHSEDGNLRRATARLLDRIRKQLTPLGRSWNHHELARFSFNPDIISKRHKLSLDLKTRRAQVKIFFVVVPLLDRFIAFAPTLPELWFDLDQPSDLESRATDVFEKFFRAADRDPDDGRRPEDYVSTGETWISWADINIRTDPVTRSEMEQHMLALFESQKMDGATELNAVGRCLDRLYPDDLQRALLREDELQSLEQQLNHPSRRPVLIVGPHLVGKTSLVNEMVYRRVERRKKANSTRENVWWLSPQRLISGMSYVGQWEDRVLAILDEATKRNHVLFFDDLPGMYRAGQSRDSNLCVADLIKNAVQSRSIRLVAEMTNEALHVFETRDRGFADQFHIIRLHPTSTAQTREIGVRVIQEIEKKHRCYFDWSVLERATNIQNRYGAAAAMPGKLVTFLTEMAIRCHGSRVNYHEPARLFRAISGVSTTILSHEDGSPDADTPVRMRREIVGQKRAIEVCSNVVSVAQAGLNEPDRPLATLLFLGPTGVGKTQSAKALCKVMFASDKHLIRFDLNQFKSAWSASTLVGTPDQPEGLLTSAIREQPFSVLLLDEIEKAHPAVFDILLQVLGEGRLTDALGRTTDFSNCVIIMTSNLGTRRNQRNIGFVAPDDEQRYVRAARDFFRPEFFNRIDEIVPFTTLDRPEIRKIARALVGDILGRQGLVRRFCILQIDEAAIDHVVELGYHPELGARAMKRALENQFTKRVSRTLAANPVDQPTIIKVAHRDNTLSVSTLPIDEEERSRPEDFSIAPESAIVQLNEFLARIERTELAERPAGEISTSGISYPLLRYFCIEEQRQRVRTCISELEESIVARRQAAPPSMLTQSRNRITFSKRSSSVEHRVMKEIFAAKDIDAYLSELQTITVVDPSTALVEAAINQAAVLHAMSQSDQSEQAVLFFRNLQPRKHETFFSHLRSLLIDVKNIFADEFGFDTTIENEGEIDEQRLSFLVINGPCLSVLAKQVAGSYMLLTSDGGFTVFQVGQVPAGLIEKHGLKLAMENVQKTSTSESGANMADDIFSVEPVRRLAVINGSTVDFPSGISFKGNLTSSITREMTLGGFPLPPEIQSMPNSGNSDA